jgi:hypothetical protein
MGKHYTHYSGQIDNTAHLLRHARLGLHQECCGLAERLWREDSASDFLKQWLPTIREHLTACAALVREIEDTLTTVEEQQAADKEDISHAA